MRKEPSLDQIKASLEVVQEITYAAFAAFPEYHLTVMSAQNVSIKEPMLNIRAVLHDANVYPPQNMATFDIALTEENMGHQREFAARNFVRHIQNELAAKGADPKPKKSKKKKAEAQLIDEGNGWATFIPAEDETNTF